MANITNRDFYLFLNSYGDWKKAADGYGLGSAQNDGVVNKGEFGKFVKTEWDKKDGKTWNGVSSDLTSSIINKFWATFDTDCISDAGFNQLDDDELNKMKLGMDAYNLVNKLTAGLTAPVGIDQKNWLTAVRNNLSDKVDEYIKNNDTINIEDLTGILNAELPNAKFTATKDLIANTILMTYQKNITELNGFDIVNDENLKSHIETYLASITDSNTTAETLKTGIENIINAYLATANITKMGENTLTTTYTGFAQKNDDPLNELQKHKATNYLTNVIKTGVINESDYANKKTTYDAAAERYIEKTLANANVGQYATIMATTWAGVKDEVLKEVKLQEKLEALFNIEGIKDYKFDLENELQKILDTNFSGKPEAVEHYYKNANTFKTQISENIDKYLDKDGNLDVTEIATYVTTEIKKLLEESPSVSKPETVVNFESMSYEDLKSYSNNYYNGSDLIDKDTTDAIDNAIKICNRLMKLNDGAYKKAIADALDISGDINSENISEKFKKCTSNVTVRDLINKVWTECDKIEIVEPIEVIDKSEKIKDDCKDLTFNKVAVQNNNAKAFFQFYLGSDGKVHFVTKGDNFRWGAWDNCAEDQNLEKLFNTEIKSKLEASYSTELESLGLKDDNTTKQNLYNLALFMALSDTSALASQYDTDSPVFPVVEAVIDNYTKLLQGIAADTTGKKLDWIKETADRSLLNGRHPSAGTYDIETDDTFQSMDAYYKDDSSNGSDDNVLTLSDCKKAVDTKDDFSYNGAFGTIIIFDSTNAGVNLGEKDAEVLNDGMIKMLQDYIIAYKDYFEDPNRIVVLFKQAQENALEKLAKVDNKSDPTGMAVYGYAECKEDKGSDNFDSFTGSWLRAGFVLINIMYEFERLVAREMAGMN